MLTLILHVTKSHTEEQESSLVRSYFALKESISFLESYHGIGFIEPKDEKTMKILNELETIREKFTELIVNDK